MKKIIKILYIVPLFLFMLFITSNDVNALILDGNYEYVIYNTKLDYDSQSSLSNTSIYKLSFQTQNVNTFEYEYIDDLWDVLTYSHLIPAMNYVYNVPNLNVVSLEVVNYSNNNVIHTLTNISYIVFNFIDQNVIFRSDTVPIIPLTLNASDLNTADVSVRLLIQNDQIVYDSGYNAGEIDGYNNGYNDGENDGFNHGYDVGYIDGKIDYGYYDGNDYITANNYGSIRYNVALIENRDYYGYYDGINWLTADQYAQIRFNEGYEIGLTSEIDWFNWAFTFITMPVRILNVEVLPNIKIGYFALFTLMTGIISWFFFIVGKGKGKK